MLRETSFKTSFPWNDERKAITFCMFKDLSLWFAVAVAHNGCPISTLFLDSNS